MKQQKSSCIQHPKPKNEQLQFVLVQAERDCLTAARFATKPVVVSNFATFLESVSSSFVACKGCRNTSGFGLSPKIIRGGHGGFIDDIDAVLFNFLSIDQLDFDRLVLRQSPRARRLTVSAP